MKTSFRILIGLISALSLANLAGAAESSDPRPNIVLIISDDQGWGDFGFMGHSEIQTPHLDRLARQSLVFPHGYVTASLCCPSLASILTGKYPHQTKVTGNEPPMPGPAKQAGRYQNPEFLAQVQELNGYITQHPRLPAELGKAGYWSFQTGKWWAGHYSTGGFTHGMSHGDNAKGGRHGDQGLKIGRETMQPIFDFIATARKEQKPFFLWYAPMLPHQPHNPPARLLEKYQTRTNSLHVARYWAMCEWFDESCGALLDHLDEQNLAANTMVLFVTDNGWIQLPDERGPRPDSKLSQYDGGLRTPIMIRWPGRVAPRRDETPVSSIDLAPTIYRALAVPMTEDLPGVNLLDAAAVRSREAIFGACFLHNAVDIRKPARNLTWRWCVSGDWKLMLPNPANIKRPNKPDVPIDAIELYHLSADPREEKNLAADQPERVARLRKLLDAWWKPSDAQAPARSAN